MPELQNTGNTPSKIIGSHFKDPWNDPQPLRLLRNEGSTAKRVRLTEITGNAGIASYPMKVPHVEIRDFDNDGWPDLYTASVVLKAGRAYPAIHRHLV